MIDKPTKQAPNKTKQTQDKQKQKEQRLAENLRNNLRRRKG